MVAPLIKLAVFAVVTITATAILAVSITNTNLSSTNSYKARFADVTQLLAGDDVRIAGVRVGQVDEVLIVDRKLAEVHFSVAADRTLPSSVTAQIKFRNLVGQRYISLGQGTGGDPNAVLRPDDTIPMDRTKGALDLTQLFNGFKPLFRALSPDDVNKLSYEIIQVLQGEGGTVEGLLAHTASLTSTIAEKDQVIGELMTNLNGVLDTVNARGPQLSELVVTLQQLVSGLAADRESIGDAVTALGDLAGTTSGFLQEAREPLKQNIAALGGLVNNLNDNEQLVEHFVQFLPVKVGALTRTVSYGSWFNFFLCHSNLAVTLPGVIQEPIKVPVGAPATEGRCVN
jgi:phospholipid/cholesterol/gamma-HCH transport system substrate-binding protein